MIVKEVDLTGKQFSNYKILNKLGSGGMATVYRAHELSLNRMVALKVLSPRLSGDEQFIKRFHREAQAAAKLNHPNIVQIYSIGEEKGFHYFAMEFIKGETLSDIKKSENKLEPAHALEIIKQVAEALAEAHKAQLVHRDIKPSNIMITPEGQAKVTDFGIAYVAEAKTKLTQDGSIIGTPEYLSPEQCEGRKLDGRSDIYSLGVTLYEILTGKTPYEADTPVGMLMQIVQGKFPPMCEIAPGVPAAVCDVVDKMMQTKPGDRYADMEKVKVALAEAEKQVEGLESAPVAAAPGPVPEKVPEPITAPLEQQYSEPKKRRSVLPFVIAAAIIILVVGGAFAAKYYFDQKDKKTTEPTETTEMVAANTAQPEMETPPQEEEQVEEVQDKEETGQPPAEDETETGEQVETGDTQQTQTADATADPTTDVTTGSRSDTRAGETTEGVSQEIQATQPITTTAGSTTQTPRQRVTPRKISPKPLPPANSFVVSSVGDEDKADMITAYAQNVFKRNNLTVIDGPTVGNRSLDEVTRYHLVVTSKHMGSTTLNYYGNSTEQYTVGLTMKAIDTRTQRVVAGPFTATVRYTSINVDENLKEAVEKLATRLLQALGK